MKNVLVRLVVCVFLAVIIAPFGAFAQNHKTISGVVLDTDGVPVIGAGVMIAGTTQGAVTDENGQWTLTIQNDNLTLEFSAMGFTTQTLSVAGRTQFDVVLKTDTQVSMVDSEDMAARPISSLSSGLQGMLPGVTIVNSSGQPGASNTTIRVRGIGTIGNANPLILIDGVEGDISAINPEDIESVSVLKDAASAAIYGARAANGVLLVTTKRLIAQMRATQE